MVNIKTISLDGKKTAIITSYCSPRKAVFSTAARNLSDVIKAGNIYLSGRLVRLPSIKQTIVVILASQRQYRR
jgi:hypothetical protein